MRNSITIAAACAAAASAAGCATTTASGPTAAACDRECLIGVADAYLASLAAHDPTTAPLADDVVIVENITQIEPGDGLWDTVTGAPTTFAIHVPDPVAQSVGFLGVLDVEETPRVVAIRLQLENGGIVEAEHLVTNAITNESSLANLAAPRPGLVTEVPPGERMTRDELMAIGASYYAALDDNDGTLAPFADDCARHENGIVTAGADAGPPPQSGDPDAAPPAPVARDCEGQLSSKTFTYIDTIDNRRMFAADPVTGLAMGLSHFRHSMAQGPYDVVTLDGSTATRDPSATFDPFDLPAAHVYKITGGEIHEIEAMGFTTPYNAPTGWESE